MEKLWHCIFLGSKNVAHQLNITNLLTVLPYYLGLKLIIVFEENHVLEMLVLQLEKLAEL